MVPLLPTPQRGERNPHKPTPNKKTVANKQRKKAYIQPHRNYLWQYFSTDQKKVLLNIKKQVDKT